MHGDGDAMEMGIRTRIRNQNLNASQMQLNLKWLESHKRGHLDPRNPAVCSSFFFFFMCLISVIVTFMASNSKRFSKRCLHLHVTHFLAPLCWAYPFPEVFVLLFFFCPRLHIELRKAKSGNHHPLWLPVG